MQRDGENVMPRRKKQYDDFWSVDCETDPFKRGRVPDPFIWGAYNPSSGVYEEFDETSDYIRFAREVGGLHYAHNGGKFDWYFLSGHIDKYREIKLINGRLAKFHIGETEFRDSYSILPVPLATYKKQEFDYAFLEKAVRAEHMDDIRNYLYWDCVFLAELIATFRRDHGNALTLAGAAMRYWQGMSGIKPDSSTLDYYTEYKPYYAGGRVECFRKGEIGEPVTIADINSAYPKAMLAKHPCGFMRDTPASFDGMTDDEIGRCMIRMSARSTGAFFYRHESGLDFPADGEIREFHITGWEYLAARDTNTLHDCTIHKITRWLRSITFGEYVDEWYRKKTDAKLDERAADELIAKLFLNALYGKYGTDATDYKEYQIIGESEIYAANMDGWNVETLHDGIAVVSKPANDRAKRFYNVATAASVTGYVRAFLWRSLQNCRGVCYCDTDSIMAVDVSGLELSETEIGQWKIEAHGKNAWIAGKKLYTVELTMPDKKGNTHKSASKGVKLEPEDIIKVAKGEEVTWYADAPTFRFTNNIIYDKYTDSMVERQVTFQKRTVRMT
jgi:hypothetical protein